MYILTTLNLFHSYFYTYSHLRTFLGLLLPFLRTFHKFSHFISLLCLFFVTLQSENNIYIFTHIIKMANKTLVIKEIARSKGMTLEDVAKKLNIHRTSLSQAMARQSFSLDKLAQIADALGVEIPDLFEVSESPKTSLTCPHCGTKLRVALIEDEEV